MLYEVQYLHNNMVPRFDKYSIRKHYASVRDKIISLLPTNEKSAERIQILSSRRFTHAIKSCGNTLLDTLADSYISFYNEILKS